MSFRERTFALVLALCLVIPMCLISVGAETEQVIPEADDYRLFHSSFAEQKYDNNGGVAFIQVADQLDALYASKAMKVIPVGTKSNATLFLNYGEKDTTASGNFKFDGIRIQKAAVGDWVALKFVSPGTGYYSIGLDYWLLNGNNAATLSAYLLPGDTPVANIDTMLGNDTRFGTIEVVANSSDLRSVVSADLSTGEALETNKEYILVVQFVKDGYQPEVGRVDMMLTGLRFGKGYEKPAGSFNPVEGENVAENIIKTAEYYRSIVGVNPANGHDLLYLSFKGDTMLVYDLDDKKVVDVETGTHSTPFGNCFDPEGNLWLSGAGSFLYKYDPRTGEGKKYAFAAALFGDKKVNGYGVTYGDGYLYFGYWGYLGRLDPTTGEIINLSQTMLTTDPAKESDAQTVGYGGMVYRDGYLYVDIFGDLNGDKIKTSQMLKYDVTACKIVDYIDISDATVKANYGLTHLCVAGDLLIGTGGNRQEPVYIDISGEKMVRLNKLEGFDTCFIGKVSSPIDGKVYAGGYVDNEATTKCIYELDLATGQVTSLNDIVFLTAMSAVGGTATIEGNDKLPGVSLVAPMNNSATGMVDVVFYNPQTRETVIWSGVTEGHGSGMSLRAVEVDPTGRYVYAGAYGTNQLAWYDTQTGEIQVKPGFGHQTDALCWYQDYLWVGNYNTGAITRFDPVTYEATPIVELMDTVFQQKRMFALTAADNKIICGTVPDTSRIGGTLVWYDLDTDLTYVAAGPNPEDVYYARTTGGFMVWRNAVTNKIETFDVDGDGLYDYDFLIDDRGDEDPNNDIKEQRFYGTVPNQCINHIFYKDGYIFGSTTRSGGQAAVIDPYKDNAQLFVYDLAAMKIVALYDVADAIPGLEEPKTGYIDYIDILEEDPYEEGKFWGVICDTLFSCTFDYETMQFTNVKEELSFAKGRNYRHAGSYWFDRAMVFDGEYLYVSFHNYGTWMINTADTSVKHQISRLAVSDMVRAEDGNLYYFTNHSNTEANLTVFRVAQYTQPLVAQSVQGVINALPDAATMENEKQVMTAYRMYSDLTEMAKAQVDAAKLKTALAALGTDLAAKADSLIDAIGEVTLQSELVIREARNYYEALPQEAKDKVTKLSVLEAAESKLAELKKEKPAPSDGSGAATNDANADKGSGTVIIVIVAAAVLLAAAVVAVLVLRKKKPEAE